MRYFGLFGILALCATLLPGAPLQAKEITPDEVYAEVYRIRQEIDILSRHFEAGEGRRPPPLSTHLTPSHSWQKAYEVLFKLNILRQKHGLTFTAIPSREPVENPQPILVYEQARRILTEIDILKVFLDIEEQAPPPPPMPGKTITDNFNLLNDISYQLDLLNGESFTPSFVFAQAMRVSEDVTTILDALAIKDDTIPPPKQAGAKPADAFEAGLHLLAEIKRVKDLAGLPSIDAATLKPSTTITPGEVFGLTGIVLAELQPLKARLGLKNELTPLARHYENRVPGDVKQVLGWSLRRMQLVQVLRK